MCFGIAATDNMCEIINFRTIMACQVWSYVTKHLKKTKQTLIHNDNVSIWITK